MLVHDHKAIREALDLLKRGSAKPDDLSWLRPGVTVYWDGEDGKIWDATVYDDSAAEWWRENSRLYPSLRPMP